MSFITPLIRKKPSTQVVPNEFAAPHLSIPGKMPTVPVRIDWSNPLTRSLEIVIAPGLSLHDMVRGGAWTMVDDAAATWDGIIPYKNKGLAAVSEVAGSRGARIVTPRDWFPDGDQYYTHVYACHHDEVAGNTMYFTDWAFNNSGLMEGWVDSGGTLQLTHRHDQAGASQVTHTYTGLASSGYHVVAYGCDALTNSQTAADGRWQGSSTSQASIASGQDPDWIFGRFNDGLYGALYLALRFGRSLSAPEMVSITRNPWQIFVSLL